MKHQIPGATNRGPPLRADATRRHLEHPPLGRPEVRPAPTDTRRHLEQPPLGRPRGPSRSRAPPRAPAAGPPPTTPSRGPCQPRLHLEHLPPGRTRRHRPEARPLQGATSSTCRRAEPDDTVPRPDPPCRLCRSPPAQAAASFVTPSPPAATAGGATGCTSPRCTSPRCRPAQAEHIHHL